MSEQHTKAKHSESCWQCDEPWPCEWERRRVALLLCAANEVNYKARIYTLEKVVRCGLELTASWSDVRTHDWRNKARAALRDTAPREERCPYCAKPIGAGDAKTCNAGCHGKGDSCRCEPPREEE